MPLRALIVDDEPLACERLRGLLESEPGVRVVGTCPDGRAALAFVRRAPPDLLFLDLHMPEMDGFSLMRALPPALLPLIILVTAHDKYAVRAFEAQAVDYLLKPFDRQRLRRTLGRAQERCQAIRASELHEQLVALWDRMTQPPLRIPVKENGRILFIQLADVDWVDAADNYIELHSGHSTHLLHSTLAAFEHRLPAAQFVRISRSTIVNVHRVKEVRSRRHGDCTVVLQNGIQLSLTRSHRHKLDQLLGQRVVG